MQTRLIFRRQNFHLFLAAGINLSILFAPLAYAANHTRETYAWLHGGWIHFLKENITGEDDYNVGFYENLGLFVLAALIVGLVLTLLILIFYNRNPQKKRRILLISLALLVIQMLLALLLKTQLVGYLGAALPGDLESHLEAQFWFHLFPPLFVFRAIRGIGKELAPAEETAAA